MNTKKEIMFLGNYTLEFVANQFKQLADNQGIECNTHLSGFNQYHQDILNSKSRLYEIEPDVIFFSIDLFALTEEFIFESDQDKTSIFKKQISDEISVIKKLSRKLPRTKIFIDNFCYYQTSTMSTIEFNTLFSYKHLEDSANNELFKAVLDFDKISIIDVRSLIMKHGASKLFDSRLYYLARSHWSRFGLIKISELYLRYLKAFSFPIKKVIVLDIDNTLWGGIIGDDGIDNIKLSREGEGKAFYDFQRELLKLYKRGILLAINSMNTREIVIDTIEKHSDMILKPEHFVCVKIDWRNKAQKMIEIANELNLDVSSFVFLDDSDYEREMIIKKFPEILTPKLPIDYADYPEFIRALDAFDQLNISNDDFIRNKTYKANVARETLQNKIIDIEDFYYSLEMKAKIGIATNDISSRIAQMSQKTNQFNLRTIRYTDAEIKEFIRNPDFRVYYINLSDKFGDYGIIGTAVVNLINKKAFIDSFIFSCRALGRTAETALLNFIISDLSERKLEVLRGEYIPTKKNKPCENFFADHKFNKEYENSWIVNLNDYKKRPLPWIKCNN